MAPKDKFVQMKNNVIDYEPFEVCKYCHRKWHRICALYDKKVSVGFSTTVVLWCLSSASLLRVLSELGSSKRLVYSRE